MLNLLLLLLATAANTVQTNSIDAAGFLFRTNTDFCDEATGGLVVHITDTISPVDATGSHAISRLTTSPPSAASPGGARTMSRYRVDASGVYATFEDSYNATTLVLTSRQAYRVHAGDRQGIGIPYAPARLTPGAPPVVMANAPGSTYGWDWGQCAAGTCSMTAKGAAEYSVTLTMTAAGTAQVHEVYYDPADPPEYDRQFTLGATGIQRFTIAGKGVVVCAPK